MLTRRVRPPRRIDLAGARKQDLQRTKTSSSSDYSFWIKAPGRKWHLNPGTEKVRTYVSVVGRTYVSKCVRKQVTKLVVGK